MRYVIHALFLPLYFAQGWHAQTNTHTHKHTHTLTHTHTHILSFAQGWHGGARNDSRGQPPLLLVLAPTRELAIQIKDEAEKFGKPCGTHTITVTTTIAITNAQDPDVLPYRNFECLQHLSRPLCESVYVCAPMCVCVCVSKRTVPVREQRGVFFSCVRASSRGLTRVVKSSASESKVSFANARPSLYGGAGSI
jgi:hypothetical protein